MVEEDDEALKKELKEAFRIYDKDQQGYITTGKISVSFKKGKLPIAIKFWQNKKDLIILQKWIDSKQKTSSVTGLEPAIPRSEVWCLIH